MVTPKGILLLGVFVIVNSFIFVWRTASSIYSARVSTDNPSFLGHDYPIMFDPGPLDLVAMTLYESVRFTLGDGHDDTIDHAWGTLFANPPGLGRVHLGADDRILAVTFVHQLHCVRELARAFHHPRSALVSTAHAQHCLTYLRQTLLCEGADTLEEGDFTQRDFETDRVGGTAVCWDWQRVYDVMGENYWEWKARKTDREREHGGASREL